MKIQGAKESCTRKAKASFSCRITQIDSTADGKLKELLLKKIIKNL